MAGRYIAGTGNGGNGVYVRHRGTWTYDLLAHIA